MPESGLPLVLDVTEQCDAAHSRDQRPRRDLRRAGLAVFFLAGTTRETTVSSSSILRLSPTTAVSLPAAVSDGETPSADGGGAAVRMNSNGLMGGDITRYA